MYLRYAMTAAENRMFDALPPGSILLSYLSRETKQWEVGTVSEVLSYEGTLFSVHVTSGEAISIAPPTNQRQGAAITVMVENASGAALGQVAWSHLFKLAPWVSPAPGYSRSITFNYNGTYWIEVGRTPSDVPVAVSPDSSYPPLSVTVAAAPSAVADGTTAYPGIAGGIHIAGGDGNYTVALRVGTFLPPGLALTASGGLYDITGVCTGGSGQTYNPTVDVASGDGQFGSVTLSIVVQPTSASTPLSMSYPVFPVAIVGSAYAAITPTVTGGTPPYTFDLPYGRVPSGTSFSTATGAFSNASIPAPYDTQYRFFPAVTDSSDPPQTVGSSITLVVAASPAPPLTLVAPTFTTATPGAAYSKSFVTGGEETGTVQWTYTGTLPSGVTFVDGTFAATAVGAASANQMFSGTVSASDVGGTAGIVTAAWSITVGSLSSAFVPPSQLIALPSPTYTGLTAGFNEYSTATYVDPGDATDLVVGIEYVGLSMNGVTPSMVGTDATGKFRFDYDGTINPPANLSADYRLSMQYTDPVSGGGGVPDPAGDWYSRGTGGGIVYANDFRMIANTAALRLGQVGDGNKPGEYMINLNTTDSLTGGKCLEIVTLDGAGAQGGSWAFNLTDPMDEFYLQFCIWFNEAALTWVDLNGDRSKKIANIETYDSGRQVALTHRMNYGFLATFLNGNQGMERFLSTAITGGDDDRAYQTAIDSGSAIISGDAYSVMRRFGPGYRLGRTLRDYGYKAAGSGVDNHVNKRGYPWPEPDALLSGAVPFTINGWTQVEVHVKNDPNNANDIVKAWAAPLGQAPKLVLDNKPGGLGTVANNYLSNTGDLKYQRIELLNYPTNRQPEPGYRPTQIQRYDQILVSSAWIPFSGHLSGSEP